MDVRCFIIKKSNISVSDEAGDNLLINITLNF